MPSKQLANFNVAKALGLNSTEWRVSAQSVIAIQGL